MAPPAEGGHTPDTQSLSSARTRPTLNVSSGDWTTVVPIPPRRRLKPRERAQLALEILVAYREARRTLRSAAIGEVVEELRGDAPMDVGRGTEGEVLYEAWRLGRAVQLTLRFVPGDTRCLTRSLVLTQLLARRGIPAKLVIGASATPTFSAHAWVEQAGHPVLPAGEGSFPRLVEL